MKNKWISTSFDICIQRVVLSPCVWNTNAQLCCYVCSFVALLANGNRMCQRLPGCFWYGLDGKELGWGPDSPRSARREVSARYVWKLYSCFSAFCADRCSSTLCAWTFRHCSNYSDVNNHAVFCVFQRKYLPTTTTNNAWKHCKKLWTVHYRPWNSIPQPHLLLCQASSGEQIFFCIFF